MKRYLTALTASLILFAGPLTASIPEKPTPYTVNPEQLMMELLFIKENLDFIKQNQEDILKELEKLLPYGEPENEPEFFDYDANPPRFT